MVITTTTAPAAVVVDDDDDACLLEYPYRSYFLFPATPPFFRKISISHSLSK